MTRRPSLEDERKKIFRRMEWMFVHAPPILAVLVAALGSLLLAALVPSDEVGFWGRWAIGMLLVLVLPALVYVIRELLRSR